MTQNIFIQWASWHFFEMPGNILKAWRNFLKFNLDYFSIPLLLRTLFSHWHRYRWSYGRGFDPKKFLEAFISNLISRILGAILRSIMIFVGILAEFFMLFTGIILFFGWLLLPALLISGLLFGFKIIL